MGLSWRGGLACRVEVVKHTFYNFLSLPPSLFILQAPLYLYSWCHFCLHIRQVPEVNYVGLDNIPPGHLVRLRAMVRRQISQRLTFRTTFCSQCVAPFTNIPAAGRGGDSSPRLPAMAGNTMALAPNQMQCGNSCFKADLAVVPLSRESHTTCVELTVNNLLPATACIDARMTSICLHMVFFLIILSLHCVKPDLIRSRSHARAAGARHVGQRVLRRHPAGEAGEQLAHGVSAML